MVSRRTTSTITLLASTLLFAGAFSHPMPRSNLHLHRANYISSSASLCTTSSIPRPITVHDQKLYRLATTTLRGGSSTAETNKQGPASADPDLDDPAKAPSVSETETHDKRQPSVAETKETTATSSSSSGSRARELWTSVAAVPMGALTQFGATYASCLERRPILTKSTTAGVIFALSDFLAQRLEKRSDDDNDSKKQRKIVPSRILASAAVGLFYFGPAAHYWYDMIFRILPGTSLVSTLQKAALGQMFFGPTFTCIFFATGLLQTGQFSLGNWLRKIRSDLPGAWLAGAGFWPLVDLVSYSLIQPQYIPLFVNVCSLVWTTYLVLKSYS